MLAVAVLALDLFECRCTRSILNWKRYCFCRHVEPNQPTFRRTELPQHDARLLEDAPTRVIHIIGLGIHHLFDPDLGDLDTTRQTRTRVAVQDGAVADALAAGFQQRILLGVQAQTRGQADAAGTGRVAARTAAFVAVGQVARRAVVARRDDARVVHQNTPDAAFHAVAPLGGERGERHEVRVPCGPESDGGREVEGFQKAVVC